MPFVLYRNTKDRVEFEHEAELMERMDETKEPIDYEEFVQDMEGLDKLAASLGYGDDLPMEKDWSVSFSRSTYGGLPCRILGHTECDFIFLRTEDARKLQEVFASGMSETEWRRHTGFGQGNVDPR